MIRQTGLAQAIDIAENRAKYDECAKKLLSYKAIIAWILKSCTKEFSQYGVQYICDNCLKEEAEVSTYAVHQDELDKNDKLDGDKRVEGMNTESNSIQEHTIYYDIRLPAFLPKSNEIVRLILNLEIQLDDTPGYPIVKRGFYYCGRMVSEQYGTVFTNEHYEKLEKVYSIWICPDPAKKRKNGIFKYHTVEDIIYGESYTKEENYDLMDFHFFTDGSEFESVYIPDGGYRHPITPSSFVMEEFGNGIKRNRTHLRMEGADVYSYANSYIPKSVQALIEHCNMDVATIDYLVMHQANKFLCERIRKKIKIPEEKTPYTFPDFGNTSGASIPLTMVLKLKEQLRVRDLDLLMATIGGGFSIASARLKTRGDIYCPELLILD